MGCQVGVDDSAQQSRRTSPSCPSAEFVAITPLFPDILVFFVGLPLSLQGFQPTHINPIIIYMLTVVLLCCVANRPVIG